MDIQGPGDPTDPIVTIISNLPDPKSEDTGEAAGPCCGSAPLIFILLVLPMLLISRK